MQAIDVVCFIIHVIVGGSIAIIETVFAGSNEMNYIQVGFPSKCAPFVTPNKFIFSNFAISKVVHITKTRLVIHRN